MGHRRSSRTLPIDPEALKSIGKEAGLSMLDVARIARAEPEIVAGCEHGETSASPRQLAFLVAAITQLALPRTSARGT